MSQWSITFSDILTALDSETLVEGSIHGLLHAFIMSWKYENNCLVWLTSVPGDNIFGSTVVFVNAKVLSKLEWTFAEWEDGTAPAGVMEASEAERVKLHLSVKSALPTLARLRKKTTPLGQLGDSYVMHFHHNLPHGLRLTVAVPD